MEAIRKNAPSMDLLGHEIRGRLKAASDHDKQIDGLKEKGRERRMEAGRMLIEAREFIDPGKWLAWLRSFDIAPRTAQRCIRLAEKPAEGAAAEDRNSDKTAANASKNGNLTRAIKEKRERLRRIIKEADEATLDRLLAMAAAPLLAAAE